MYDSSRATTADSKSSAGGAQSAQGSFLARKLDEMCKQRAKTIRSLQQRLQAQSLRNVDMQPVIVWFVDDSREQLDVTLDITAHELLLLIADAVHLEWPEMFALCEVDIDSTSRVRWLDAERSLRELSLDLGQRQRRLQCRLKYDRQAIPAVCKDARFVRVSVLQARERILAGDWPCSEALAVRLAGSTTLVASVAFFVVAAAAAAAAVNAKLSKTR